MINFKERYKMFFRASLTALAFFILYVWIQAIFSGEEGRVPVWLFSRMKRLNEPRPSYKGGKSRMEEERGENYLL